MKVKMLLTPSSRFGGLPTPIPKEGETPDLDEELARRLIHANIAVAIEKPKRKIKAVAPKPAIAKTETAVKNEDKE